MRTLVWILVTCTTPALAQSAWLPSNDRFAGSGTVVHQSYDEFFAADARADTTFGELTQISFLFGFERGFGERLAFDGAVGYSETSGSSTSGLGESGMTDSTLGVRWRVVDELTRPEAPTVTLRAGAIVEGTYETGNPAAPGDGASGLTGSVLVGKMIGDRGFGVHGDAGYRAMAEQVPDAVFGSATIFRGFGRHSVSAGYRYDGALSGIDIGSPEFTPARLPETQEIAHVVEIGWSFSTLRSGTWSLAVARTIDGRNTDRKTALMATVSY